MAQTINILPEHLANKIAAGEVVQRPGSAVKELLENAVDAGATTLSIIVKDSGKKLIQIVDDGCGMSRDDAVMAFHRHATSKISTYEDLERITTLGFRGEALASIAAVSHVELRTRQTGSDIGTKVRIEGGRVVDVTEELAPFGTSISVKNLFYNTPGRRNFLKSDTTEFKHILDAVLRIAISYPSIAIRFSSDDEIIYDLRPNSAEERLKNVFGNSLSESLMKFEEKGMVGTLSGFLCKPDFARKTRTEQYLFLNNRFIVSKSINHAVFQAYERLLEKGSFPLFVLFLSVEPGRVDVNVHPSKMEVKFADDSGMYRFVLSSVRKVLSEHDLFPVAAIREQETARPEFDVRLKTAPGPSLHRNSTWGQLLRSDDTPPMKPRATDSVDRVEAAQDKAPNPIDEMFRKGTPELESQIPADYSSPSPEAQAGTVVWQVHNKYIFIPVEKGVMIVDQHAAHERVLYERIIRRFQQSKTEAQQLLFPQTLEMSRSDAVLVQELHPLLENLGFSLKVFGKTTIIVDGVPTDVKPGDEGTILQDVLDLFKEDEHSVKIEPRERLAKSFSCKAAIKAGDPLNEAEIRSLVGQLFTTEMPHTCPHGRPIIIKLSLSELDKRFGRSS